MEYFISDLHFNHANIIKYDNRPFKTTKEMDETIINNWNKRIKNTDIVYILGDIGFGDEFLILKYLKSLNGKKVLIKGNHDNSLLKNNEIRKCFIEICDYKEIHIDNKKIILCHYPIICYNGMYRDSYMLYGHVHNTNDYEIVKKVKDLMLKENLRCNLINVGCCLKYMDYTPRTFIELKKEV